MSKTEQRVERNVVHFHLMDEDQARLTRRASTEPGAYRRPVSVHEMARRMVLAALDGEVRIAPETRAALDELAADEESTTETVERVLKVGIGRLKTLAKQKEGAT